MGVGLPVRRSRRSRADVDAQSAARIDDADAVLIRHVVAKEDGDAALVGRLIEDRFNRPALVGMGGQNFGDRLATLEAIVRPQSRSRFFHKIGEHRASFRRHAPMYGQRMLLVLQHRAGPLNEALAQPRSYGVQARAVAYRTLQQFTADADFKTMQAAGVKLMRGHKGVDIVDATTAHQRHRAVKALAQGAQGFTQFVADNHGVRRGRNVDQRAVKIEKQRVTQHAHRAAPGGPRRTRETMDDVAPIELVEL